MGFAVCLKAHLRDEKIDIKEIGPRMDWQFCNKLNRSIYPPLTALKLIAGTVNDNGPIGQDANMKAAVWDETSEQVRRLNHAVGTCMLIKKTPMTLGYVT